MATAAVTNEFTASTTIVSDDVDTNFADLVTFLNGSVLHLDGAKTMTGNLNMGNKTLSNLDFTWTAWTGLTYGGLTVGNGTVISRYFHLGDLVIVRWQIIWGSTTSLSGDLSITSLPVTPATTYEDLENAVGLASFLDDTASTRLKGLVQLKPSTGDLLIRLAGTASTYLGEVNLSATVPWTWVQNDVMWMQAIYEAA